MDALNEHQSKPNSKKSHVSEAATHLLDESKKFAHELYEDSLKKVDVIQKETKDYADELLNTVREHPLKAILIAGGVGLLLSTLLRK